MTSIIDDFVTIGAELSKLEQAKMPTVQPDFSNSGDVTDEARKTYYGMFGYPMGGIDDMASCFGADVPLASLKAGEPIVKTVSFFSPIFGGGKGAHWLPDYRGTIHRL